MSARGPYAKGEAKRKEILRVALDVVAEMGCRSASNREIARRVGLSQAGLAHYFDSREDLYMAVLRTRDEQDTARFQSARPTIEGFFAIMEHNAHVPGLVQLYIEFSAEASIGLHPAHEYFTERYEWVRGQLAQIVRAAQEADEMGQKADPDEIATLMVAAADGLQQQWLLDRSIDMVARLRRLWDGIVAESLRVAVRV
ncbi:MAG TPA: TetR/AcrR family transcriptional regulator [Arachnia sp.]|nr:TetR/AcrR family transcriptional regulator [Arachnia sp.]HMR14684.1 TetR/AcrR family transcriptional regulator [Arachnia sp.]